MVRIRGRQRRRKWSGPGTRKWTFYEVLVEVRALLVVDEKYTTGISLDKSLTEVNRVFLEIIESLWNKGEWVNHAGAEERRVTLEESNQSGHLKILVETICGRRQTVWFPIFPR
jgi:hypothetical protein